MDRGWSQERLAEELTSLLADAGRNDKITQRSISQWEGGQHVARRDKLAALERLLRLERGTFSAILEDAPLPAEPANGLDRAEVTRQLAEMRTLIDRVERSLLAHRPHRNSQ
jgi:transcriptional regulator with XRE-family HTH domain